MRPSLLIISQIGALLMLICTYYVQAVNSESTSVDSDRNKRLFMLNSDLFRNRRMDTDVNLGIQPTLLEQRSIRRSQPATGDTRRRQCFFSPVQCNLLQLNNGGQETSAVEVFRPLLNSAASRKRQIARQNALRLQHWRTNEGSNRFRL
ncbi:hypothetical protein M3Y97_00774300 [Aphelenchoides bicaudatus]|nr:hypothetical protein M3Y97_00774300 [Aphelenchoides bicaudatus]